MIRALVRFSFSSSENFYGVGHQLSVGADWDGKGRRDICISTFVPTAGGHDSRRAIGFVSMDDGALLRRVVRSDASALIAAELADK